MDAEKRASLSSRLLKYSAIASVATGVMLSAAPATPVFADPIVVESPNFTLPVTSNSTWKTLKYPINFDSTGDAEVGLAILTGNASLVAVGMSAYTPRAGDVRIARLANQYPVALHANDSIGPALTWGTNQAWGTMTFYGTMWGNWTSDKVSDGEIRYLGVEFKNEAGTATHYGWIELSITHWPDPTITIHRFGYETSPNTTIAAGVGDPASVALASTSAIGSLQAIAAGAFAALGGALTWIHRKLSK